MFRLKTFVIISLVLLSSWAIGRLYYTVTDGFALNNIVYDLPFEVRREVKPLNSEKEKQLSKILDQPYSYYSKGCQSYVFLSADGEYVLKFFKYQRYRPQEWLEYFSWLAPVERYRLRRLAHKKKKLDKLFNGWKVAYEDLPEETGLVYVQLSRQGSSNQVLTFSDKMGFTHQVNLNEVQFLVQHKADMLCPTIEGYLAIGDRQAAQQLIHATIDLFLSEYERGYVDFDPAIMQNTGVLDGKPIHVDVGQITQTERIFKPEVWKQDLFNKTYKFRLWLMDIDQQLAEDLEVRLKQIIGPKFETMTKTVNG